MPIHRPKSGWPIQSTTTHPGAILREDFLLPLGLTANGLALRLRVPATRIHEILQERRAVSPGTALRLARFFNTSPAFWLNLQQNYDLSRAQLEHGDEVNAAVEPLHLAS